MVAAVVVVVVVLAVRLAECAMVKHECEPAGGVPLTDSHAPRMDATGTVGFSQTCLFNYQSLEITNGLELMAAGSQVTNSVLCCRWRRCADS